MAQEQRSELRIHFLGGRRRMGVLRRNDDRCNDQRVQSHHDADPKSDVDPHAPHSLPTTPDGQGSQILGMRHSIVHTPAAREQERAHQFVREIASELRAELGRRSTSTQTTSTTTTPSRARLRRSPRATCRERAARALSRPRRARDLHRARGGRPSPARAGEVRAMGMAHTQEHHGGAGHVSSFARSSSTAHRHSSDERSRQSSKA